MRAAHWPSSAELSPRQSVRWYLRSGLSYRDVEELLAERGILVDHVTVYRWVQRFTVEFIEAARPCRRLPGDRWFVDETYVKGAGQWTYLYRAVDQHGQVIDVMLSVRRDLAAARAFFARAVAVDVRPAEVTTDRAHVYPRVLDEQLPAALHVVERYANNPIEADHSRLKARLRPMRVDYSDCGLRKRSPLDTRSCRTCGAATTRLPPTTRIRTSSARRSTNWPVLSDKCCPQVYCVLVNAMEPGRGAAPPRDSTVGCSDSSPTMTLSQATPR